MKSYMSIANGGLIYLLAGIVILVVMVQSVYFLRMAWQRGVAIGLSKEKMKQAIKQSAVFSVLPSLPIVISLIVIAPVLGIPFTWLRLSVIGSNSYELIAADQGAKAMGFVNISDPGYNAEAFSASMWIMSIGIIWGIVMCIFALKWYQAKMKGVAAKDNTWGAILMNALFFGMMSVFIGRPVSDGIGPIIAGITGQEVGEGGLSLLVMMSSAAIMVIMTQVAKRLKIQWLGDFALSLSMILGMVLAIVYTQLGVI